MLSPRIWVLYYLRIKQNSLKLINDLFEILETSENEKGFTVGLALNPDHIIFSGHFPGHPVTPAVVQLQIIHELIEMKFGRKVKLVSISKSKFLKVLNPTKLAELDIHIDFLKKENELNIKAYGENASDIYFRIDSTYHFI